MDYQEALQIIREEGLRCNRTFVVSDNCSEKTMRLFVSVDNTICQFAPRSRKSGYRVPMATVVSWTCIKTKEDERANKERRLVEKFKKYAAKATFPSAFVRKCIHADMSKGCYENRLTTGCAIDGQVITLNCIEKYAPYAVLAFREALKNRTPYHSSHFPFQGYDGSLWIEIAQKEDNYNKVGDVNAGFSKEYKGCANGYYYALINDNAFIGVDKD